MTGAQAFPIAAVIHFKFLCNSFATSPRISRRRHLSSAFPVSQIGENRCDPAFNAIEVQTKRRRWTGHEYQFGRQIEYRFGGPLHQRLDRITLLGPVRGSEAPFSGHGRRRGWQGKIPQTATKFPQNAR